jgi:hypothetical protein
MSLPFTSLDAVTSVGPGTARDLGGLVSRHTALLWSTGGPSITAVIEGSHDGTNWVRISSNNMAGPISVVSATDYQVRYVRANLTAMSGGSSPTVTVTIASGEE